MTNWSIRPWLRRVGERIVRWRYGLLALVPPAVLVGVWFGSGRMVYFIDSYFPFNPAANLLQYSTAWGDANGVGTLNVTNFPLLPIIVIVGFFRSIGFGIQGSQAALFFVFLAIGSVCTFLFVRDNSFRDLREAQIAGIAAAVAFVLSPVFLELYWYLNFPSAAGLLAGLPAVLLFLSRGFRSAPTRKSTAVNLLGLSLASVVASAGEIPYLLGGVVVAVSFVAYQLLSQIRLRGELTRRARFTILALICTIAANVYWAVPELLAAPYVTGPRAYSGSADMGILSGNSAQANPFALATLQYFPTGNGFANWSRLFGEPGLIGLVVPVLFAVVVLSSALPSKRIRTEYRCFGLVLTFLGLFVGLETLLAGTNPYSPLSDAYLSIFNANLGLHPFLRGPYLTWGAALGFCTAYLFGVGVVTIVRSVEGGGAPTNSRVQRWRARFSRRIPLRSVATVALVSVVVLYGWPYWTGAAVGDLSLSATPTVPPSVAEVSAYLQGHPSGQSIVVYPGTDGLVDENWTPGYVGPPILQFSSGRPTFQYIYPPLGGRESYEIPMAFTLPSLNSTLGFVNLLRMLGAGYAVVDSQAQFNSVTSWSNLTATQWALGHTSGIHETARFGGYTVFQVDGPVPRIFAANSTIFEGTSFLPVSSVSKAYAQAALNNTDLSSSGYFTSSAEITRIAANSFNISSYWPNLTQRKISGTGIHYPGWPEVVNTPELDVRPGTTPLLSVRLSTFGNLTPIVAFSGVPLLRVYPDQYARTINQFFSAELISQSSDPANGSYSFLFNLAGVASAALLPAGVLRHILIELQPRGNYSGPLNATVSMELGVPRVVDSSFDPARTVVVPDRVNGTVASDFGGIRPVSLAIHESNPAQYSVTGSGSPGRWLIVLDQEFDQNWRLSLPPGSSLLAHFPVDGFANGWLVDSQGGNVSMSLSFSLQDAVAPSMAVSAGTLAVLGLAVVAPWFLRRARERRSEDRRARIAPIDADESEGRPN